MWERDIERADTEAAKMRHDERIGEGCPWRPKPKTWCPLCNALGDHGVDDCWQKAEGKKE